MCAILYFFLTVCNKPHANPTIIYENIKEIHSLAEGGTLEFPILSHVLLRRVWMGKLETDVIRIIASIIDPFVQQAASLLDGLRYLIVALPEPSILLIHDLLQLV